MKTSILRISLALVLLGLAGVACASVWPARPQLPEPIRNSQGLRLLVAEENTQPTLRIVLPRQPLSNGSIEVIFPEHVTARKSGSDNTEHLYLFQMGTQGERPAWRRVGQSLQYEKELTGGVHFLAKAKLEDDGVRFHYEFTNNSSTSYDMIYAVTDPRMTSIFHDVRLERTYVHRADGFGLIAADTPARLTMPLDQWLPARYLDSFTWPVPDQRVEHRDGMTYYNASRAVDQPFIATLSTDHKWVVASFTRDVGNVWTNPELTCQHVDPQTALAPGQHKALEVKILVLNGSLEDALKKIIQQRTSLSLGE
jgi:hypothetical protein